jgi:hypothetical protein
MIAAPQPRDVFHHAPLPDAEAYIRLLRIKSSPPIATPQEEPTGSKLVECELTSYRRADAPPYRALSYTWGDRNLNAWIRVNG